MRENQTAQEEADMACAMAMYPKFMTGLIGELGPENDFVKANARLIAMASVGDEAGIDKLLGEIGDVSGILRLIFGEGVPHA